MQRTSHNDKLTVAGLCLCIRFCSPRGRFCVPKGMRELTDDEYKILGILCVRKKWRPIMDEDPVISIVTQGIHTPTNGGYSLFWAIVKLITEPDSINLNEITNTYLQHDDTNAILYTDVLERIQYCMETCKNNEQSV